MMPAVIRTLDRAEVCGMDGSGVSAVDAALGRNGLVATFRVHYSRAGK
ncbi:MAG TPA: hypothetical protein VKY22_21770 [Bradyrhizobium sp.]|nr:hypothetical protein [Bradyrhizobium sp.]